MLRIDSSSTSYSASSIVSGESIANFNASINNPGEGVYISIGFNSLTSLQANLSEIKEDFADFLDQISE